MEAWVKREREKERERESSRMSHDDSRGERERERESVCVCVCVFRWGSCEILVIKSEKMSLNKGGCKIDILMWVFLQSICVK